MKVRFEFEGKSLPEVIQQMVNVLGMINGFTMEAGNEQSGGVREEVPDVRNEVSEG